MHAIGIIANLNKPIVRPVLEEFLRSSDPHRYQVLIEEGVASCGIPVPSFIKFTGITELFRTVQLITSFGGDGTLLRTAQMVGRHGIPILGINLGGLGFLTASSASKAWNHIGEFFNHKLKVEKRTVLKVSIGQQAPHYFLNDFVVDKAGFSRLITIITRVEGMLLNSFMADGLIISTPTGSTAYSLANGGPIVVPSTNALIINPICPHTLSNRPIIISDTLKVSIQIQSAHGRFNVFGDGQMIGTYPLETDILLEKAEYGVHLVQTPEHEFFTILREKLGWGEIKYKSDERE